MDLYKKILKEKVQEKANGGTEIKKIEIDKLKENPYQPRIEIKEEEVKELAKSIEKNGLLQPINVYQSPLGDYYIISGHRRVEAHKLLNKKRIKAIVYKNQDNLKLASKAIVENLQREDLNIIELALFLKRYKEEFDKTMEDIAEDIGKSKSYVIKILNVLKLPESIIKDIKENKTTKDILALNLINSFANKLKNKVNMFTKTQNPQEYEILKDEFPQKWENEIFEVYKGFLKNGREWLKSEIENRLKQYESQEDKNPILQIKVTKKHGTTIKINKKIPEDKIKEIELLISNFIKNI